MMELNINVKFNQLDLQDLESHSIWLCTVSYIDYMSPENVYL